MSDAPRQLPPKKEVALTLLEGPSLFVHLDPRHTSVIVPRGFLGQSQLVLQIGLNMNIPIPDLKVDDEGITCTLSFNRAPFWCRLPWGAIYALVGEDGRGMVWPDDVPPEVAQQIERQQAAAKAGPSKRGRAKLAAVESSDDDASPRRAKEPRPSGAGLRAGDAGGSKEPKRLEAVPSHPGGRPADRPQRAPTAARSDDEASNLEEAVDSPVSAGSPVGGADASGSPVEGADSAGSPVGGSAGSPVGSPQQRPAPAGGKKPKRELPPYLRVIK